ncbi:AsmA family protein [Endozoicomonas sp. GU-1]|uniref:AsmA family protein n=1 Tax=Endozoicomonas sp. GU-1 TaxID=3009078 RepID=UPI0022B4278E|nr:AsmA family protein [Endozoicomonas sp. GU-1]WBA81350.1 AsmA family protein [Endozoicomonas sp. GU-1]WBA84298.1 AsmA family protein [Endozoicomonas sp. GU-1]
MNRILKFIAVLLAAVVLLGVIGAALLPRVIDPNQYRDEITRLVYEQSGLKVSINGPIGWSIFPWVGLSLEDVSVAGANNSHLAQLGSAGVSVKLIPLISKRIEMQTLELTGLELTLVKNTRGKGNWQVSAPTPTEQHPTPRGQEPSPTPESEPASPVRLDIASVNVSGLLISYEDQVSGQKYMIDQASLTTGAIRNQQPFDFQLTAHITIPDLVVNSLISGKMTFNLEAGHYDIQNLKVSATPDVEKGESLSIVGNVQYQQTPMLVKGNLGVAEFNLANLLNQIKVQLPPMADPKALNRLSFDSHFSTNGESLSADKLQLQLDSFTLDGHFRMNSIDRGDMQFSFTGNDLNLDNYLPPATDNAEVPDEEQPAQSGSEPPAPGKEHPLIPEAMLRGLNLDGSMKLASLTVAKFIFEQPSVSIKAARGEQEVTIGSRFYQGTIDMTSNLDVRRSGKPKMAASAELKNISLEALSTAIPDLASLKGDVNAGMKVHTQGQYASVLTKNLNGNVEFKIDKGAFTDANFDKLVCEGVAKVRKKELRATDWGTSTEFTDLSGSFVIKNGVAKNDNLIAALAYMNLKGDGQVNLVDRQLDYRMGLNIRGEEAPDSDPACQINKDYVNVTWPVRCHGDLGALKCGVDFRRLTETIAEIAENRLKQKIEDKVQGPVKDLLQGFFK